MPDSSACPRKGKCDSPGHHASLETVGTLFLIFLQGNPDCQRSHKIEQNKRKKDMVWKPWQKTVADGFFGLMEGSTPPPQSSCFIKKGFLGEYLALLLNPKVLVYPFKVVVGVVMFLQLLRMSVLTAN